MNFHNNNMTNFTTNRSYDKIDPVTISNELRDIFDLPFNKSDVDVTLTADESLLNEKLNNSDGDTNSAINIFPIIPFSVLFWYLICVHGSGVIINCLVILDLFRRKHTNGFFTLILQLAFSDILLLTIVAVPEMWSHNGGSWIFGSEMCLIYLGSEVFSGTSNVYFLISICFHTVTTVNVILKNTNKTKESEEQLLDEMTEIKSSRHSLVSRNNDSLPSNKTTDMGFRNNKAKIPVIVPVILVWILAASLSVPEFALSTTIVTRNGPNICTFIDGQRFNNMRILLSIFQLIIPMFLLVILMAIMIFRMYKHVDKLAKDVTGMLKVSIWLQIVYFFLNTPRSIISTIHVLSFGSKSLDKIGDVDVLDIFKAPPLNNSFAHEIVLLVLSFLYFFSSILRPLFYCCFIRYKKRGLLSNSSGYSEEINEENRL